MKVVDIDPEMKEDLRISDARGSRTTGEHDLEAGIAVFPPGFKTHWHQHNSEQLHYVISGKGAIGTEKEQHIATPGKAFLIPRNTKHFQAAAEDSTFTFMFVLRFFPTHTTAEYPESFPDVTVFK